MLSLMKSLLKLVLGSIFVWMITVTLFASDFGFKQPESSEEDEP